jgi:GH24 family phage-related lysozyme (muramidase)
MRKLKLLLIFIFVFSCVKTIDNKDKTYIEKTNTDLYYYNKCLEFLKSEEGLMLNPYRCTSKKMTIGYGHRILKNERKKFRKGITVEEAEKILIEDYNIAIENVKSSNMIKDKNDNKYIYLYAILCFQTGKRGFEEFVDFIGSVEHSKNNDNPDAKVGIYYALKDSKLNKQAPNRVDRYINLIVAKL